MPTDSTLTGFQCVVGYRLVVRGGERGKARSLGVDKLISSEGVDRLDSIHYTRRTG